MTDGFRRYRRNLPHWRQLNAVYFITWRIHESQSPLSPQERDVIEGAFWFFHGQRYKLWCWVIMDDHAHIMLNLVEGFELEAIMHSWKSFTCNRLQRQFGRQGPVWQREYLDRVVRDEREFEQKFFYVVRNPFRRWPELTEYKWVYPQPEEIA